MLVGSPEFLDLVFPFRFCWGEDDEIKEVGPSLEKLVPSLVPGARLSEAVMFLKPRKEVALVDAKQLCVLAMIGSELRLRGQVCRDRERSRFHFFGGPALRKIADLEKHGIGVRDFALHDGSVDHLSAMSLADVTVREIQAAAKELGTANQQLEDTLRLRAQIFGALADLVFVLDPGGTVLLCNEAVRDVLRLSPEELTGKQIGTILEEEEEEEEDIFSNSNIKRIVRAGGVRNRDVYFRDADGRPVPTRVNGSVMRDDDGEVTGLVLIARDMRERRRLFAEAEAATAAYKAQAEELAKSNAALQQAHDQLQNAQAQLVQAGKLSAVGELAGGVAHELNNPLHAVVANSQFLDKDLKKLGDLPAELEGFSRYVARILGAAERCRVIVQGLLSFSRQSGGAKRNVHLKQIVDGTLDLVATKVRHQNTELKLEVEPGVTCIGNEVQLQQVLLNLIINATQALGKGGVITVTTRRNERHAILSVHDTGPGISEDVQQRIFEPFFTTKEIGKGTGLGLSISFGIVEDHGGKLLVESSPGQGTTFTIMLPSGNKPHES